MYPNAQELATAHPENLLALSSAYMEAIEECKKYMVTNDPSSEKGMTRLGAVSDFLSLYRIESDLLDKRLPKFDDDKDDF